MVEKWSNLNLVLVKAMCGEFGEVTVIIGLVINFLALGTLFLNSRVTLSYVFESGWESFTKLWMDGTSIF